MMFLFLSRILRAVRSDCEEKYAALKDHTMCKYQENPLVTVKGVSEEDKEEILRVHNALRAQVDPPAADMFKLVWDEEIAKVAQRWAGVCLGGHDANRNVPEYHGVFVGQNMGAGQSNWTGVTTSWYNECWKYGYTYGVQPRDWKLTGHFVQVVTAPTRRVGCGYALCGTRNLYVCNYAPGLMRGGSVRPYAKGAPCSACPDNCQDGLCDCGGLLCLNGGQIDINKCTCTCKGPFGGKDCSERLCDGLTCLNGGKLDIDKCTCNCKALFGGKDCSEKNCPAEDNHRCGKKFPEEWCTMYRNIPGICPYMCGICGNGGDGDDSADVSTEPPMSVENCPKQLPRDENLELYNGMCYRFVLQQTEALSYWAAQSDCKAGGGNLIMIKDKELNRHITNDIRRLGGKKDVWIGLTDHEQEGTFLWADGTRAEFRVDFTMWDLANGPKRKMKRKKNKNININNDCAAIRPINGKWRDYECDVSSLPYICQYEPSV